MNLRSRKTRHPNAGGDIVQHRIAWLRSGQGLVPIQSLIALSFGSARACERAVDSVMMRIVDIMLAIPTLVLLLVVASIFRPDLLMLIVIISLLSWLVPARLVRGEALTLRTREYVQAVRMMGGGGRRTIIRHIVPNAIGVIVVNATFQVADAILLLAVLSFLGLGLPPPAASWGGILSDGLNYLYDGYWWLIYPAGLAIVITVISFNFIGDALRDSFDVRLRIR